MAIPAFSSVFFENFLKTTPRYGGSNVTHHETFENVTKYWLKEVRDHADSSIVIC
ncbi:hypothetical protein Hanom_Chr06g00511221 [Helianthus anomalus]